MKIGIIAANNTRYSPYIYFYTGILERCGIAYDVIVPDKHKDMEQKADDLYVLPWTPGRHPLINYASYANHVKKLVKRQKYDGLIVLTGNNAAFLAGWLKRHYAGRYIVDIRDYTHENIKPYYLLEKKALSNSLANVLSSAKFKSFLPSAEYLVCHNVTVAKELDTRFGKATDRKIDIGYVGALGYTEQCKRMMDLVKADDRFVFSFYGSSKLEPMLKEYAASLDCDRIRFFGAYTNKDKPQIIEKVDILFNAYGNGIPLLDYALSNKMYDAMAFKKPILTSPHTYMDELAGPMSLPIDLKSATSLDGLYDRYQALEEEEINAFASEMHRRFLKENEETCRQIEQKLKDLA